MSQLTRIGVLSSYFSGVHLGPIFAELIRLAPQKNCRIIALTPGEVWKNFQSSISSRLCDAWLVPLETVGEHWGQALIARGVPVCCLGHQRNEEGFSSVRSDNRDGVFQAMESLYALGHRDFVFFGNLFSSDIRERRDAFVDFLIQHKLKAESERVFDTKRYSRPGGASAIEYFEKTGVSYSALVAGNDQVALGALSELRHRGLEIPGRVALIGYDNIQLSSEPEYCLSSVDQNSALQVAHALDELLDRLSNPSAEPRHLRVPPRLICRQSSHGVACSVQETISQVHSQDLNRMYSLELSRLFNEAGNRVETMLETLASNGRQVRFVVFDEQSYKGWLDPNYSGSMEGFGTDLVEQTEQNGDVVVIQPKEFSGRLDTALAVSIPRDHLIDLSLITMAAREIELTATSIDRIILQSRLEALVEERTQQLKEAQRELIISAQTAAMVPIVRALAHRLNTPLGNSLLTLSHLRALLAPAEAAQNINAGLDLVERNITRVAEMVKGFQQICDLPTATLDQHFDLRDAINNAIVSLKLRFPKVVCYCSLPSDPCLVKGEKKALDAVLDAILENSAIHGGRGRSELHVFIELQKLNDRTKVLVQDDGAGMEEKLREKAFEPFFTTQWSDANGLGLTLVHRIMTSHFQGSVTLQAAQGGGLLVTLDFKHEANDLKTQTGTA